MCLGGGGSSKTYAPVSGGFAQATTVDEAGKSKYKLYDDQGSDITKDYKVDGKQNAVRKDLAGATEAGGLIGDAVSSAAYLYKRKA
jgi:hypothetical protein